MKNRRLQSLLFAFVAVVGVAGSANAAVTKLTTEATGVSLEHAKMTAARLLKIQCNLMFGELIGEPIYTLEEGFTVQAEQDCNH
ncbi:hypothetical protein [Stenotrophomonas tumulicola]|uniref:Uncharacterized protein n=1 Tax=Stenotrophomonas tumulicola TaxID=1685415 RepID=A0A7W3IIF5_9GAMM|nr:hypothetical protein [Stenotrophomonas tumulicola]MBA8681604.1 hypothetical protein [Stenotrophomonas tumulicola]